MRYFIRCAQGELKVETYAELRTLYQRQFLTDDDEVRKEDSQRWVKVGAMPDLRAIKPRRYFDGLEFAWLAVAICVISLILIFFFRR